MKTNLKIILILLIAIIAIGILSTTVNAEYLINVQMTPDKIEVNPGDTINVVVKVISVEETNLGFMDLPKTGFRKMEGNFEYDTKFFDSITASQGNLDLTDGDFILSGNTVSEDEPFAVLQLKVSDTATGMGSITFSNIITLITGDTIIDPDVNLILNNGITDSGVATQASTPDITLTFNAITGEKLENTNEHNNSTNIISVEESNNGIGNNTAIIGNNITSKTQLPYAGIKRGIFITVTILLAIGIGSYVLYQRYNNV